MEPEEILTLEEIKAKYPDEWVLVEDPETDEHLNVTKGKVRFHSKDREAMYREAIAMETGSVAFVYTGSTPKGVVFAL